MHLMANSSLYKQQGAGEMKYHLPNQFVVFDMEWTAWEGCLERSWNGQGEYPEIFNIGAILIQGHELLIAKSNSDIVNLEIVKKLPPFTEKLTGYTQTDIDKEGIPLQDALDNLVQMGPELMYYFWGSDHYLADLDVLKRNLDRKRISWPFFLGQVRDIRPLFISHGVPAHKYSSSTIPEYFGLPKRKQSHRGEDDALSIVTALKALLKKD